MSKDDDWQLGPEGLTSEPIEQFRDLCQFQRFLGQQNRSCTFPNALAEFGCASADVWSKPVFHQQSCHCRRVPANWRKNQHALIESTTFHGNAA
ncbi:hypothetical protein [Occallatibacter savannae]|uniref:hypothetical protein n=1 Tax=Occallatibacter savannae TaxID=1002691 RepID=UPI0013A5A376|nr:hypothetical protein [Occallatibacter savannae]